MAAICDTCEPQLYTRDEHLTLAVLWVFVTLFLLESIGYRVLGVASLLGLVRGLETMRSSPEEVAGVEVVKLVEEDVEAMPLPVSI